MRKEVGEMYKIAVLGDMDSVLGFKALGLEVCPVSTPAEGLEAWKNKLFV